MWVGEYATSLEMAGASVSLMRLDDELRRLVDAPAETPVLRPGMTEPAPERADGAAFARCAGGRDDLLERGTSSTGSTAWPATATSG